MNKRWNKILRSHLSPDPAKFSNDKLYRREHRNDFHTPPNLIVVIKTKRKHFSFGGPIYGATITLRDNRIQVVFVPPKFKGEQQYLIPWNKITAIDLHFLP